MLKDDDIELISKVPEVDSEGNYITDECGNVKMSENSRTIYCKRGPVTQTEFFKAGQDGFNPQMMFAINPIEYNGESIVIHNKQRYSIYRTYERSLDKLELYVEDKAGVTDVKE